MAFKLSAALMLFSVMTVLSMSEVNSLPAPEPEPVGPLIVGAVALTPVAIDQTVKAFSCRESTCYQNNWQKRDRLASNCSNSKRWSYDHEAHGKCYCYKCI